MNAQLLKSQGSLRDKLKDWTKCVCDGARIIMGFPDYETYVAHMKKTHPDQAPIPYEAFFRERQEARYGASKNGGFKCC